jgi:hypothetical protein
MYIVYDVKNSRVISLQGTSHIQLRQWITEMKRFMKTNDEKILDKRYSVKIAYLQY